MRTEAEIECLTSDDIIAVSLEITVTRYKAWLVPRSAGSGDRQTELVTLFLSPSDNRGRGDRAGCQLTDYLSFLQVGGNLEKYSFDNSYNKICGQTFPSI